MIFFIKSNNLIKSLYQNNCGINHRYTIKNTVFTNMQIL